MSESFVAYRKSMKWFERGREISKQLKEEMTALVSKETEWSNERSERRQKIDDLKQQITDNFGRKSFLETHKKTIDIYKCKMAYEEEMMQKMEYATKCLEFIKGLMIRDADRQISILVDRDSHGVVSNTLLEPEGLYECQLSDKLTISINKLASYLEGHGSNEITIGNDKYAPAIAIYHGGVGKFIKIDHHELFNPGKLGIIEHDFPSIFDLQRSGFSLDDVIGLAHIQFIGDIREHAQPQFEWVNEITDRKGRLMVIGYYGVSWPPEYFLENDEFGGVLQKEDWRCHIPVDRPAKMYIGDYSRFDNITSMEDILEDGRLYDNRFGLRYDSTPQKITWQFNWQAI